MSAEQNVFDLVVGSNTAGIRKFLQELQVLPQALSRISREIGKVDLGDGRKFDGDGKKLARALVDAFRAEVTGGKGSFQKALNEATKGLSVGLPQGAAKQLQADIRKIASELRSLPQNTRIGIKLDSQIGEQLNQAVAQARQSRSPRPAPAPEVSDADLAEAREARRARRRGAKTPVQATPADSAPNVSDEELAAARQARQAQSAARAAAKQARGRTVGSLRPEVTPEQAIAQREGAQEAAAARMNSERTQRAGRLEEQAYREDAARAERRQAAAQRAGTIEERAYREDATRAERRQAQAQRAGLVEERAYREDSTRAQRRQAAAQRAGQVEERAYRENAKRTKLADPNSDEAAIDRAVKASAKTRASRQRLREMDEANLAVLKEDEAVLERASRAARQRNVSLQRAREGAFSTPEAQARFNQNYEAAVLRRQKNMADAEAARQSGPLGGIKAGLMGFGGMTGSEFVTRIGVSSLTYNAVSQISNVLFGAVNEVVTGTLEYEKALSQLSVMYGQQKGPMREYAMSLGQITNAIGLSGSVGVALGGQARALYGPTVGMDQNRDVVRTVSQIGFVSGANNLPGLQAINQDLAGITKTFGMSADQVQRVADAAATIYQRTGVPANDLLTATGSLGEQAHVAGFSVQETMALLANQANRAGIGASSAEGQLSQVLGLSTEARTAQAFQEWGINTLEGTFADWVKQAGKKLATGEISDQMVAQAGTYFGRSHGGAAFVNLIRGAGDIEANSQAAATSPGATRRLFDEMMNNISSKLTKMVGAFRDLATAIGQSGVFDLVGVLVPLLTKLAEALTELLQTFNKIPREVRSSIFVLGELYLAMGAFAKLKGSLTVLQGAADMLSLMANTKIGSSVLMGLTNLGGGKLAGSIAGRAAGVGAARKLAVEAAAEGAEGAAGLAGKGAGAASAVAGLLTNPVVIAALAAAAVAIGIKMVVDKNAEANRAETKAASSAGSAQTVDQLRKAAADYKDAADIQESKNKQFFGLRGVYDSVFGGNANDKAKAADVARQQSLEDRAAALEKTLKGTNNGFGSFQSIDQVTNALAAMENEGMSAAKQVDLLSQSFSTVAEAATSGAKAVLGKGTQQEFGQSGAVALTKALQSGSELAGLRKDAASQSVGGETFGFWATLANPALGLGLKAARPEDYERNKAIQDKLNGLDQGKMQGEISTKIQQLLVARGKDASQGNVALTQEDVDAVNAAIRDYFQTEVLPQLGEMPEEIRRNIQNSLKVNLAGLTKALKPAGSLSVAQIFSNFLTPTLDKIDQSFGQDTGNDKAAASTSRIQQMRKAIKAAQEQFSEYADTLTPGELAQQQGDPNSEYSRGLNKIESAQRRLDGALKEDAQIQLARQQALINLRRSRRGSLDQASRLADAIDSAQAAVNAASDPTDKAAAQASLNDLFGQRQQYRLDAKTSSVRSKIDPRNTTALARAAVTDAKRRLDFAKAFGDQKAIDDAMITLAEAQAQQRAVLLGTRESKRLASVAVGDNVAAAQTALKNAEDERDSTLKGTDAYYAALVKVAQARKGVTDALSERHRIANLLTIDLTDPVAQAQAEVRAAREALAAAKGPDDKAKAQLDLRNAQNSAEAAAFSQRLSDIQTADELGRISHQAYLQYLQNEHNRLSAIAHRTRQQQDELDQVDKLMKAANDSLSGQFNLGEIKLPTVYQVRRAIQAGVGGIMANNSGYAGPQNGQVVTDNSQRTLVLQGVPLEEVLKRIAELYGGAPLTATSNRRL